MMEYLIGGFSGAILVVLVYEICRSIARHRRIESARRLRRHWFDLMDLEDE